LAVLCDISIGNVLVYIHIFYYLWPVNSVLQLKIC